MQENKGPPNLFTETIYMLQFYYTQYTAYGAQGIPVSSVFDLSTLDTLECWIRVVMLPFTRFTAALVMHCLYTVA
jgi:hypothetical protein